MNNDRSLSEVRDLANLQAQMLRPAQSAAVDGGFELGWGIMVLCAGLGPFFNAALPKSVWASVWTAWIGYLPLVCMAFAPYAVPKTVKRFVTWPRAGYVANPNEMKLGELLRLMAFGLALGFSVSLPFVLVMEIRGRISHNGPHGDMRSIVLHSVELLVCAALTVYLGRKTIRKRQPLPTAYDSPLINQALRQTATGRNCLRGVKLTLLAMAVGVPILLGSVVFGLIHLGQSVVGHANLAASGAGMANGQNLVLGPSSPSPASASISSATRTSSTPGVVESGDANPGAHWVGLGFMVVANVLMYLMANAVTFKRHWWKWLGLAILLVGPIAAALAMPHAGLKPTSTPILEHLPPSAMLCIALVWLLSGAATLISFIRRNPLPSAET